MLPLVEKRKPPSPGVSDIWTSKPIQSVGISENWATRRHLTTAIQARYCWAMYRTFVLLACCPALFAAGFLSSDVLKLRSVGAVRISPDGEKIAYTVTRNDSPRGSYGQLWIMTIATGASICLCSGTEASGNPEWSPDGKWIAYSGTVGDKKGVIVARPDGSGKKYLGPLEGTNAPLPTTGKTVTWSPDGKQIAYVSAQPGPETADATGDPVVITRYLYKPTAGEGNTRFNDNKRLHIFVADVSSGTSRQLTSGTHYEHSIDWSPDGKQIAFISNREPNEDQFFNYDLLTLDASTGEMRRLTATENAE
jgi:Tol biopolymer transport system component